VTPDLQLTGPAQDPRIDGVLTFSHATLSLPSGESGAADGAMYLSGDDPDDPVLSLHVAPGHEAGAETWLYGARSAGMNLSWGASAASDAPSLDAPNEMAAFGSAPLPATPPLFLSFR
jgi:hypothetical protein